jgi:uncharacterized protein YndB with AHSA1/START domain
MRELGITIVRVFDAPRERLWREWTEPAAFADWFGGDDCEIPLASMSMDVRPGGSSRATMLCDGGRREILWTGGYLEVVEPERLVFTLRAAPAETEELVAVVLRDLGDGRTELRLEQRGHLSPEEYERTGAGWTTFFDRLSARLADA